MISIIMVDDEQLFLDGVKEILSRKEGIEVVKCYNSSVDFLSDWRKGELNPDIVLMDINIPEIDGVLLTHYLMESNAYTRVIGLSSHYTKTLIFKMMQMGASAYLPKNVSIDRLLKTIRKVHEEGFYFDDFRLKGLHSQNLNDVEKKELLFHGLSEREIEVLKLICEQRTNYEIGDKLFISTKTVERHRSNIFEKTKSKNVVGLVLFALKYQLVEKEFIE